MYDLKFSTNWNNKLDCKYYTTIRIYNPNKYVVGTELQVLLKKNLLHIAKILAVKKGYLKDLGGYECYLDTGYSKQETIEMLKKMYPNVNFKHQLITLVLLKRIEPPKPVQQELFNQ